MLTNEGIGTAAPLPGASEADPGGLPAQVAIEYFTDPLCVWSWAMEPPLRRLLYEFGALLTCRFRMGGLIADWQSFQDPLNAIQRPSQMGPHWFYVRRMTGMPLDERIWLEDPPASSYPACLAVKAAEQQGEAFGAHYLRCLREAVLLERRNIARLEILLAVAEEMASETASGGLDVERLRRDMEGPEAQAALREDLKEARYRGIGRFPTLILRGGSGPSLLMVGYRPYPALRAALAHLTPDLTPLRTAFDAAEYANYWGRITAREIAEALEITPEAAVQSMTKTPSASTGDCNARE